MSSGIVDVSWDVLPQREKYKNVAYRRGQVRSLVGGAAEFDMCSAPDRNLEEAGGWEYLDHTADVQIHSWGLTMNEAFAAAATGMFGYMVELEEFKDVDRSLSFEASGHDWQSMLFSFLDECLFLFHTESFVMRHIVVKSIDAEEWKVSAVARGSMFDISTHNQGTEVKAITYSNMQLLNFKDADVAAGTSKGLCEIYVIVDI